MKKTTSLLVAGLLLTSVSFAQKGSVLVAGSLTFMDAKSTANTFNNENAQRSWTLGVLPQIGYQFANAWTAGVFGEYTHGEQHSSNPSSTNSGNYWALGPFLRYTRPITTWVSFYAEFHGEYQDEGQSVNGAGTYGHAYGLTAAVLPALFFNIKNGFGINVNFGGLSYNYGHVAGLGNTGSVINLDFGSAAVIGISKNFGGRKNS